MATLNLSYQTSQRSHITETEDVPMSATSRKYADVPLGYQLRISGLGAKIRSEREKLGLSSGDLSKMINATTEWLWQIETGYRTIGLHHVPILESALKTTLVDRQSLIENILSIAGKTS